MGDSVAGKIRIDLLTNVAQFKAGMREAGRDGLGGFREEAERFNRGFDSKRTVAKRTGSEQAAWRSLSGPGGPMYEQGAFIVPRADAFKRDMGLANEIKAKSMLPWGNTLRSEMSREAALTAAAIGDHKQTMVNKLRQAAREIGGEAAQAGGLGGMATGLGRFAVGHPLITAGAMTAGFLIETARHRHNLALDVNREALMLGQTAEETSKLHAIDFDPSMGAKFLRSMSDQSPDQLAAFKKLRLNPDELALKPLTEALKDVGEAFDEKLRNPADRASVAMHLFGRAGAEVISTLAMFREKMDLVGEHEIIKAEDVARAKAAAHAWKGVKNDIASGAEGIDKWLGQQTRYKDVGLGTALGRSAQWMFSPFRSEEETRKREETYRRDDYAIANADKIEAERVAKARLTGEMERSQKAAEVAAGALEKFRDKIYEIRNGTEAFERRKSAQELDKLGLFNIRQNDFDAQRAAEAARNSSVDNLKKAYDKLNAAPPESAGRDKATEELKAALAKAKAAAPISPAPARGPDNHQVVDELKRAKERLDDARAGPERDKATEEFKAALAKAKAAAPPFPKPIAADAKPKPFPVIGGTPEDATAKMLAAGVNRREAESYLRWRDTPGDREFSRQDAAKAEQKQRKAEDEAARKDQERLHSLQEHAKSAWGPELKYQDEIRELDDLYSRRGRKDDLYWTIARQHLQDYYREAAGMDEKQLREQLATPGERFKKRMADVDRMQAEPLLRLDPELANRARQQAGEERLRGLGIKDPLYEYQKSMSELEAARPNLRPELYERRRKELRRGAVGEMTSDYQEVSATPALQQGSQAAYSAIVQSMMSDPKIALQQEANRKLDAIDRKMDILAGRQNQQLELVER